MYFYNDNGVSVSTPHYNTVKSTWEQLRQHYNISFALSDTDVREIVKP